MKAAAICMALPLAAMMIIGFAPAFGEERNSATVRAFKRGNPCPANGNTRGPCPGWVVDHVMPLCAGGADAYHNLQWQTVEDAKRKDVHERRYCACVRRGRDDCVVAW